MAVDLSVIMNWLKMAPSAAWSFVVVIGLMLWGPEWFVSGLGLEVFVAGYRDWFGVFFLLSLIAALTQLWRFLGQAIRRWYRNFCIIRHGKKRLKDLTPNEKTVLKIYLENDTRTQTLALDNGVTAGLLHDRIIYCANEFFEMTQVGMMFDFNIQSWAWKYLRQNRDLLK